MVLMQCVAAVAILYGSIIPSCSDNSQCDRTGLYCTTKKFGFCGYCGFHGAGFGGPPLQVDQATGLVWNSGTDPGFQNRPILLAQIEGAVDWSGKYNYTVATAHCFGDRSLCGYRQTDVHTVVYGCEETVDEAAVTRFCDACVHPTHVDTTMFYEDVTHGNLAAMNAFDWMVLVLATGVVATIMVGELRDIELCQLALDRTESKVPIGWRVFLRVLGIVRRYAFLPALLCTVPALVLAQGGDALSIAMNTVAVLFLVEVDVSVMPILEFLVALPIARRYALFCFACHLMLSTTLNRTQRTRSCLTTNFEGEWRRVAESN